MLWFWIILGVIAALNVLFTLALVVAGIIRERQPLTPQAAKARAEEDEEQVLSLREWSKRQGQRRRVRREA